MRFTCCSHKLNLCQQCDVPFPKILCVHRSTVRQIHGPLLLGASQTDLVPLPIQALPLKKWVLFTCVNRKGSVYTPLSGSGLKSCLSEINRMLTNPALSSCIHRKTTFPSVLCHEVGALWLGSGQWSVSGRNINHFQTWPPTPGEILLVHLPLPVRMKAKTPHPHPRRHGTS